ncbi:MAG: HNH endonuclease [Patescibacteria group bacterium]|nr:HNH endonuclease [Patescibacteria group bacterium]
MPENSVQYRSLDFLGCPKYRVGDDGSVWSKWGTRHHRRLDGKLCAFDGEWRRISPGAHPKGHLVVGLCEGGKKRGFFVHRLVLLAFIGPCPDGMEGCHFPDRNPANNRLENLRWDTKEANEADRIAHGTDNRGSHHGMSKLTEVAVAEIRRLHAEGGWTYERLGAHFSVNATTVYSVIRRRSWKHIA